MLPGLSGLVGFSGSAAGGGGAFDPATLFAGTAGGYWDPSDLATMFQTGTRASPGTAVSADGDPVGLILDKSGNNNDLVQATSGNRPLYKTSAGLSWLLFDGTNDFLKVTFTMSALWDNVSGIRPITTPINRPILSGGTADVGLFAIGDNSNFLLRSSGSSRGGPAFTSNTDYVVAEQFRPQCQLATENGAFGVGGVTAGQNPGGLTVGATYDGTLPTSLRWHGTHMIDRAYTAGELASLRTFFAAKQGRVL